MIGSHRVAGQFGADMLAVLLICSLSGCSNNSTHESPLQPVVLTDSMARPVSSAVPILLSLPESRVQRHDAVTPRSASENATAAPSPWVFESSKDGSLPVGAILPPDIFAAHGGKSDTGQFAHSTALPDGVDAPQLAQFSHRPVRQALASVQPAPAVKVMLYASPTTAAFFAALGVNYQHNLTVWQDFMARHDIEYEIVKDVDVLRYHRTAGVLLLPAAVALNDEERAALTDYRRRGGSILATWLNGVRGPLGEWRGFDFMSASLNTGVAGDTRQDKDDVYITPYGDSPVTHQLAAGLRVWTARTEGWYPLRLTGVNSAAAIMDWSRSVRADKTDSVISYNERVQANGLSSRVVVLGYPERIWSAADPVALDAIAYDALTWLARRPAVYLGTWPAHHRSAVLMALDESHPWADSESRYAALAESLSGHVSYYVLTQQLADNKNPLQSLQARGHEIAYMGDRFDGFGGQSQDQQQKRVTQMLAEMEASGISGAHRGFHAPMESFDQTTKSVLQASQFGYFIGDAGMSETRLPAYAAEAQTPGMLILPRTQNGPDDVLSDKRDFKDFLAEFDTAEQMGGLSVVRIPSASRMQTEQWEQFAAALRRYNKIMWVASGSEIADWWQERSRVRVTLDSSVMPALLTVDVAGEQALQQPVTVMANLPHVGARLQLLADDNERAMPVVVRRDVWRADIELGRLAPGAHHWFLHYSQPPQ